MPNTTAAIIALKKKLGAQLCIMGHHYQSDAVVAHCDITGDSLELARRVANVTAEHIVFCGVFFMGESAALLAGPNQSVHLPDLEANCMMSLMTPDALARKVLTQLNARGRKIVPLAYVNTTLGLKAVVGEFGGAVCTSANAETMLRWALDQGDGVLFLPDKHLGRNMAAKVGLPLEEQHILRICENGLKDPADQPLDRRLLLWPGCCPVHAVLKPQRIDTLRGQYPGCKVMAHPECRPELINACDATGSTSFLIGQAARMASDEPGSTLIIATEENLVNRLTARHAGRCRVLPLDKAFCKDMAKVTEERLLALLEAIDHRSAAPLTVDATLCPPARLSLTRMLEVCEK